MISFVVFYFIANSPNLTLSCRSRTKKVPYSRQHDEKETRSLERKVSEGKVNPAADILSEYEMSDMFYKVQQVSW